MSLLISSGRLFGKKTETMTSSVAPLSLRVTMMKVVVIPSDLSKDLKELTVDKSKLKEVVKQQLGGANFEHHMTPYQVTQALPEELQEVHRHMVIVVNEGSFYLRLPFNKRASHITGLGIAGDCVVYVGPTEDENGFGPQRDMLASTVDRLWNATKNLKTFLF